MRIRRSKEDLLRTIIQALRAAPHRKLSYAELEKKTGLPKSSLSYVLREMVDQGMIFGFIQNRQRRLTPVYKLIHEVHRVTGKRETEDKRVTCLAINPDGSVKNLGLYLPVRVKGGREHLRRIGDSKVTLA